jgi:signal transduction histidine kinase
VTRTRFTGAQLNWLLRLVELPTTLVLVALFSPPGRNAGLFLVLLGIGSAAWIGWLWVRPWRSTEPACGPAAMSLMVIIAAASGLAVMVGNTPGWTEVLVVVVALQAGTTLLVRTAIVPVVALLGIAAGCLFYGGSVGAAVNVAAAIGALFAVGVARGFRSRQLRQAQLLLAQEQQTRVERERAAALGERTRIAREIHDILAHSLADLSIQLELADALLSDGDDQAGALDRVRRAHHLASEGIEETRRAVHALRSETPPLPDALAVMVGAYRDSAVEARFEMIGSPRPLPAAAGLALVRTAQEALVNARKHASWAPIVVRLDYGPENTGLTIYDGSGRAGSTPDPVTAGVGGGYGLAGMSERLRLVGGSLTAGPLPDGWTVHAEVPA